MYNNDYPDRAELPTPAKLLRSTIIASAAAAGLLFTTILPAEYAVDPTGIGRLLGLTQMGEIKQQLAAEAAKDASGALTEATQSAALVAIEKRLERIEARIDGLGSAAPSGAEAVAAAEPAPEPVPETAPAAAEAGETVVAKPEAAEAEPAAATAQEEIAALPAVQSHVMEIVLEPGQGAEIKLAMREGAEVAFRWEVDGGAVNFDAHGDPPGAPKDFYHGYGKGRGSKGEAGTLKAAFDGKHGWFWRNRSNAPVTVKLETNGDYQEIKRVI